MLSIRVNSAINMHEPPLLTFPCQPSNSLRKEIARLVGVVDFARPF